MDVMELGAIGELVGGVAVIATLIYLAIQVRHTAESNLASTQFGIQTEFNRLHEMLLSNPEILAVLDKAESGGELDAVEQRQFYHFAFRLVNQWISVQVAYDHGSIDRPFFLHMKEDVKTCCERWPGLESELRTIHDGYSIRPELFDWLYARWGWDRSGAMGRAQA